MLKKHCIIKEYNTFRSFTMPFQFWIFMFYPLLCGQIIVLYTHDYLFDLCTVVQIRISKLISLNSLQITFNPWFILNPSWTLLVLAAKKADNDYWLFSLLTRIILILNKNYTMILINTRDLLLLFTERELDLGSFHIFQTVQLLF